MEESTPAESEFRREAEVVKQVRDCDMELEPRISQQTAESTQPTTAPSSPTLTQQEGLSDVPEDDIMGDISMGLSSSFKQHAIKNSKGKPFWDAFPEPSGTGGVRTTPPPAAFLPRGSSSGISEDVAMDSPSVGGATVSAPLFSHDNNNVLTTRPRRMVSINHLVLQKLPERSIVNAVVVTMTSIPLASNVEPSVPV